MVSNKISTAFTADVPKIRKKSFVGAKAEKEPKEAIKTIEPHNNRK